MKAQHNYIDYSPQKKQNSTYSDLHVYSTDIIIYLIYQKFSSVYFALYAFFMYPAYTAQIPNTHANKKHYNNPFSWSDEGRPVPKPKSP